MAESVIDKTKKIEQYRKVLAKILGVAQENAYLWDCPAVIFGKILPFVSRCDEDGVTFYGIAQIEKARRLTFCTYELVSPTLPSNVKDTLNARELAEKLQSYDSMYKKTPFSHPLTPNYLGRRFIKQIEDPLMRYLEMKANVSGKLRKKLRQLELAFE